jgi:hypothetical protein
MVRRSRLSNPPSQPGKPTPKQDQEPDFDVDVKLGAVAGHNGAAACNLDVKLSRRNGTIKLRAQRQQRDNDAH